eukprot:CAMPEP_0201695500 /NCGR_PEP_ID=MMETSP0578-20130828/7416_1 /ASSEMBLY_ACC=CAM_ASM_000663 /TAXON_ID=267565 /ORGANISM="Skeletonema grethea, Strain CCMP 1804" /LENGTH=471 /DNA_ID=CAMNT_0048181345 /DNA_START=59 /DNA_END=1471 /DNA_ORIENTATION=-
MMRTTSALVIIQLLCAGSQALRLTSLGSLYEDEAPIQNNNHENGPSSAAGDDISHSYGVDRSFPIQHDNLLDDGPFNRRERQKFYHSFMDGCRARESNSQKGRCNQAEADRIATNLNQPSRTKNYTKVGYEKVSVPTKLVESLNHFWKAHERHIPSRSYFETGSTDINHWASGHFTMSIDDEQYHSNYLRGLIWEETKPILEKWAGVELSPSSLFGLQIYTYEAVMPHRLDTLPFVINAIIHVADKIDKPWPIELYGHDGVAKNVTLEVGSMLLYEGQSVIMGRPYPMAGQYQAEIFISFEPLGYSRQHDQHQTESLLSSLYLNSWQDSARVAKRTDVMDKTVVPPYIANSFWEDNAYGRWKQDHPKAKLNIEGVKTVTVHTAAAEGDLDTLKALEKENSDSIFFVDENGWTALHEAVRGGHINVAEYLINKGLDVNFRTHNGTGGSPLWWAKHIHGESHVMVKFLEGKGA